MAARSRVHQIVSKAIGSKDAAIDVAFPELRNLGIRQQIVVALGNGLKVSPLDIGIVVGKSVLWKRGNEVRDVHKC